MNTKFHCLIVKETSVNNGNIYQAPLSDDRASNEKRIFIGGLSY